MKLTFLGTSTSVGIPVIGCCCPVCLSTNPRFHRLRSSIHIETEDNSILIDSGPDLRAQALRHSLSRVDAVLYTHQHLDHTAGFDELRAFCWNREEPLPLYSTESCLNELKRVYDWAFSEGNSYKGYIKPLAVPIVDFIEFGNLKVTPIPVEHGSVVTIGYRFDYGNYSVAYIPDVKRLKPGSELILHDLDYLIVDCLREEEHGTHMSLEESLALIDQVKPKQSLLTHISHEMDIEKVEAILPTNVNFAYDTLSLIF